MKPKQRMATMPHLLSPLNILLRTARVGVGVEAARKRKRVSSRLARPQCGVYTRTQRCMATAPLPRHTPAHSTGGRASRARGRTHLESHRVAQRKLNSNGRVEIFFLLSNFNLPGGRPGPRTSHSPGREREREKERALLGTISITGWSRARPADRRCLALCGLD